jgi:protein tyrosine kinase modulator
MSGARDLSPAPLPSRPEDSLEDEIDFTRYFRVFARHWILLVVVALAGGAYGFAVSRMKPILYEGVTTVLVLPPSKLDVRSASIANFRALLENLTHSSQVINELGLDKPPFSLTPQRFHDEALQVEEVPGTNLVKVRVKLTDPARATEASRRLAQKAVSLNTEISRREGSSIRDLLNVHLKESSDQLKAAETQLLAYQREAQVELLKRDTESMLDERGDLLKLTIDIESEKARLKAAEVEIGKQQRVLSIARSVPSEDALRRAAESDRTNPANSARRAAESDRTTPTNSARRAAESDRTTPANSATRTAESERTKQANSALDDAEMLDLSNPFINPVYQTLEFQIATGRARLAALEQQRREIMEVKKLGGRQLKELSDLYSREIELARLQTNYDLAKRVYSDLRVRYEETRSEGVGSTAVLQIVDDAIPPDRPLSRQGAKSTLLGLAAGFMVAALGALALDSRQSRGERRT